MKPSYITIKNRRIGLGHPCFIVAEISANHNGDFAMTKKLIKAIAETHADAIKVQTYTPDSLTIDAKTRYFRITGKKINKAWQGKTLYQLFKEGAMPWEWQPKLKTYAENLGLIFFSTPFDEKGVDFLETINVPCYKVASYEITHIPLLKKIGETKKPVILSRGMASIDDITLAIKTLKGSGAHEIIVLHCISSYPAQSSDMNLLTIPDIRTRFKVVSGLSDHSMDIEVAIAATALGASVLEKHVTLSRANSGIDAAFSLEPNELTKLIKEVRNVEIMLGNPYYGASGEREAREIMMRRSLFVVKNINKGDKFTNQNLGVIRPGYGLHPKFWYKILGKKANQTLKTETPLSWKHITL